MSERVAHFVLQTAKTRGDINAVFVDVRDNPQTGTNTLEMTLRTDWQALVQHSEGIVIISPEYNHAYPGELKHLLDCAYGEYEGKPVAICGVSNGPLGGARMAEQLKLVLSAFQMMIINAAVYFANVNELFDASGEISDKDTWEKKVNGMLDQVLHHTKE